MSEQKRASFAIEDMRQGGGNLWGTAGAVRAAITGGKFTKEAPDNYSAEGNPIFGVVDFLLAGDAPEEERRVNQSFSLGAAAGDNFTVSEDGDFLIPTTDDAAVIKDSKFGTFACSLQNEGVKKEILQDFAFSKIVGLDGDFKRIADKERTFVNDKKDGAKKKFPPSTLCLVKLHALNGSKGATTAAKTTAAPGSATPAASSGDLDTDTLMYLEQVLKEKGGTEQRGRLTLSVSKAAMKDPNRQNIARRASEESFIQTLVDAGLVKYGATEKGQPVSLAA